MKKKNLIFNMLLILMAVCCVVAFSCFFGYCATRWDSYRIAIEANLPSANMYKKDAIVGMFGLIFSSIGIVVSVFSVLYYDIPLFRRSKFSKQQKIAELEKQLDELKKDE